MPSQQPMRSIIHSSVVKPRLQSGDIQFYWCCQGTINGRKGEHMLLQIEQNLGMGLYYTTTQH